MIRWMLVLILILPLVAEAASGRVVTMNERVLKALNEAQTLMDAEDYDGALEHLDKLLNQRLAFYEKAQVKRLLGHVYYQMEAFESARETYEEVLLEERLPDSFVASLLGMLGRLGLIEGDYDYAVERFKTLLAMEGYDLATNRVMLASAYLQQDRFVEAEEMVLVAIEKERRLGNQPREQWLLMLTSCYYGQDKYEDTANVLREIVALYPAERHMINLAAMYGLLGERSRQLTLVEALLDDGRINESRHVLMLASLFMAEGLPFKAARLMEDALADQAIERNVMNLEQLSQAWFLAGHIAKSLPPLEEAADMAEDGKLHMRLAQLYMDAYQWEQAETAARIALEKGDLRSEGRAWLIRGMAMAHQQRLDDARERFEQAATFDDSETWAGQWISFVENEQSVQAAASGQD